MIVVHHRTRNLLFIAPSGFWADDYWYDLQMERRLPLTRDLLSGLGTEEANLIAMASKLAAMASKPIAMASKLLYNSNGLQPNSNGLWPPS